MKLLYISPVCFYYCGILGHFSVIFQIPNSLQENYIIYFLYFSFLKYSTAYFLYLQLDHELRRQQNTYYKD